MPDLETLESRLAPATVTSAGGNLLVGAQVGPLLVETASPTSIHVQDNVTNAVFVGPFTRVRITDTPGDDAGLVSCVASALNATLEVRAGRGNDQYKLEGTVNGNVSVSSSASGLGPAGNLQFYIETAATTVNGNLSFSGGTGTGALGVSGVDFLLTGNLTVNATAMQSMQMWLGDYGATGSHQDVLGAVNYAGGAGSDTVTLYTFSGGDMTFAFGGGTNVFADTPDCVYTTFSFSGGATTYVYLFGTVTG